MTNQSVSSNESDGKTTLDKELELGKFAVRAAKARVFFTAILAFIFPVLLGTVSEQTASKDGANTAFLYGVGFGIIISFILYFSASAKSHDLQRRQMYMDRH